MAESEENGSVAESEENGSEAESEENGILAESEENVSEEMEIDEGDSVFASCPSCDFLLIDPVGVCPFCNEDIPTDIRIRQILKKNLEKLDVRGKVFGMPRRRRKPKKKVASHSTKESSMSKKKLPFNIPSEQYKRVLKVLSSDLAMHSLTATGCKVKKSKDCNDNATYVVFCRKLYSKSKKKKDFPFDRGSEKALSDNSTTHENINYAKSMLKKRTTKEMAFIENNDHCMGLKMKIHCSPLNRKKKTSVIEHNVCKLSNLKAPIYKLSVLENIRLKQFVYGNACDKTFVLKNVKEQFFIQNIQINLNIPDELPLLKNVPDKLHVSKNINDKPLEDSGDPSDLGNISHNPSVFMNTNPDPNVSINSHDQTVSINSHDPTVLGNVSDELSDLENVENELSDLENVNDEPSYLENVDDEPSDLDNVNNEQSVLKNIKGDPSLFEDISNKTTDSEDIGDETPVLGNIIEDETLHHDIKVTKTYIRSLSKSKTNLKESISKRTNFSDSGSIEKNPNIPKLVIRKPCDYQEASTSDIKMPISIENPDTAASSLNFKETTSKAFEDNPPLQYSQVETQDIKTLEVSYWLNHPLKQTTSKDFEDNPPLQYSQVETQDIKTLEGINWLNLHPKETTSKDFEDNPPLHYPQVELQDIKTLNLHPKETTSKDFEDSPPLLYPKVEPQDIKTLEGSNWLNDVIIEFYLSYIYNEKLSPDLRRKIHICSPLFYTKWNIELKDMQKGLGRPTKGIERWLKNVNLFTKDFIVIPMNPAGKEHWYLVIICYLPKLLNMPSDDCNTETQIELQEDIIDLLNGTKLCRLIFDCDDLGHFYTGHKNLDSVYEKANELFHLFNNPHDTTTHLSDEIREEVEKLKQLCSLLFNHHDTITDWSDEIKEKAEKYRQPCILFIDSDTISSNLKAQQHEVADGLITLFEELWVRTKQKGSCNFKKLFPVSLLSPLQPDSNNCGIFLLMYAEVFFQTGILFDVDDFTPEQLSLKRKYIVKCIEEIQKKK